ncbi:MAG: hypothetical protein QOJ89_4 [bacterium]
MSLRRAAGATSAALVAAMLAPAAASAHGLVGKRDLPIPQWLFAWGATVVLVVSFVGLSALWKTARLQETTEKRIVGVPRVLDPLAGLLGVAAFAFCVYAGFAGRQEATTNVLPTVVYVVFWVAVPFASVLFGDVFRAFNPWRAVARAVAWTAARVRSGRVPEALPYPAWLGRWPAVAGILAFAWVELCYTNKADPSTLAVMALAYAAVQLVAMVLYGIDEWSDKGDAFGSYFGLFARLSPLRWGGGALWRRRPLSGVTTLAPVAGTVALVCTAIGTTSFDGFSNGPLWNGTDTFIGLARFLENDIYARMSLNVEHALEAAFTTGMLLMVAVIATLYRLGIAGMSAVDRGKHPPAILARQFVHSLVPIALAYLVAHYFSLLIFQGQAMAYLISDPLGHGANLFGTATATIDYNAISATTVWYVQVAALLAGHVSGLVLAHDRALVEYRTVRLASASQRWMLAVMVAFTTLALYLLSSSA